MNPWRIFLLAGVAGAMHVSSGWSQPEGNLLWQTLDADRDGKLSAVELDGASNRLRQLDANSDGAVSFTEAGAGLRPVQPGDKLLEIAFQEPAPKNDAPATRRPATTMNLDTAGTPQKPAVAKDPQERKILDAISEMQQGPRYYNVSTEDGRLLRQLAETMNAQRVVEIGTSTGESAVWFALALRKTGGRVYTHDIDPGRLAVARENFKKAGVEDIITVIEGDAHSNVGQHKEPIDILFLDADKEGYIDYLDKLVPVVRPGGLIIAHNMHRPAPNPAYIEAITTNPDFETSFVFMETAGIGITLKKR